MAVVCWDLQLGVGEIVSKEDKTIGKNGEGVPEGWMALEWTLDQRTEQSCGGWLQFLTCLESSDGEDEYYSLALKCATHPPHPHPRSCVEVLVPAFLRAV